MATLFLAFTVPDSVAQALQPIYAHYVSVLKERTPRDNLHVTLVWLGPAEVPASLIEELLKPLPQSFVPTVRITHVGRGRARREQLWAAVEATGPISAIRQQLQERLKKIGWQLPASSRKGSFSPHITVGKLYDQVSHIGVADHPLITSYTVSEVILYQSDPVPGKPSSYTRVGQISLV